MELTLQHLGQGTRDIGKKVSNEKDDIHSEHFWNKTADYFDGLSDSARKINDGISDRQVAVSVVSKLVTPQQS